MLAITATVEIIVSPAIVTARVKLGGDFQGLAAWKHRGEGLVLGKELVKEGSHFICDSASSIREECFIDGGFCVRWRSYLLNTWLPKQFREPWILIIFFRLDLLYLLWFLFRFSFLDSLLFHLGLDLLLFHLLDLNFEVFDDSLLFSFDLVDFFRWLFLDFGYLWFQSTFCSL